MKTVGVVTYHRSINYGAILQAYSLQEVLSDMGYGVELIDYQGLAPMSLRTIPSRLKHYMWTHLLARALVGNSRVERTNVFRRRYLRISHISYDGPQALHMNPPEYDAYITGSDQVWNPLINGGDSSYFLTFAPRDRIRISYAASFGVSTIAERFRDDYAKWLSQIHHLSTREYIGKDIVRELSGRDSVVTLDPTLLLDQGQWDRVATPYGIGGDYILCYYMPGDSVVTKCIGDIARRVSCFTGWPVVNIGEKEYMRLVPWRRSIFDAGPAEFVGLVRDASFIVTNSFHGAAFAVNYRKPFVVPINSDISPERSLASRILTLLGSLGLKERLLPATAAPPEDTILHIEYQSASELLQRERQRSMDFLNRALGGL